MWLRHAEVSCPRCRVRAKRDITCITVDPTWGVVWGGGSPWEDKEGNGGQEGYMPTSCQLQLPGRIEHGMQGDGSNQNPAEETSLCPQTPLWNSPSALHFHVSQSYSHPAQTRRCRRGCSNSDEAPWGTHTENKPFFRDGSRMLRSISCVCCNVHATC